MPNACSHNVALTKSCKYVKELIKMSESQNNINTVDSLAVHNILKEIGMQPHLKGYDYTKTALSVVLADPSKLQLITKPDGVYAIVAAEYGTTASRVERAMRHSIEVMYKCCPEALLWEVFGNSVYKAKPTNSMFIAGLRNELLARAGIG